MSSNTFRVSWWVVRMVIILAFPQSVYSADTAVSSGNVEAQGPLPLERLVSGPGIWSRSPAEFESAFRAHGLQWLSQDKDRARFFGENLKLWDGTIQPAEIIVQFKEGKPRNIDVSVYNRADSQQKFAEAKDFMAQVEKVKSVLEEKLSLPAVERRSDVRNLVKTPGWLFSGKDSAYLLEYSFQREVRSRDQAFQPEFLRLRVANQESATSPGADERMDRRSLSSRVRKDANGDMVIPDVPMVDQGPKGYCAVATTERMMRYYGMDVDQHEIAQLAGSQANAGTNPQKMMEELRSKQGRLRLRVRELETPELRDYQDMIKDYNRLARSAKKLLLPEGGDVNLQAIFMTTDPELLKEARTVKDRSGFSRFERTVQTHIDRGVPLLWSVQIGVFPELGLPQASGGHMRLIIGYNTEKKEILYSDSWGAAHALKHMPLDKAWTITLGLGLIEPSR